MTKPHNLLSARAVATIKRPGRHSDGGCLYLKVTKTGQGITKSWTFMYARAGKQREAGFVPVAAVSLAQARVKAAEARALLAKGLDPLDAKKGAREAEASRKTFGQCADALLAAK